MVKQTAILTLLLSVSPHSVAIRVSPYVVQKGNSLTVTCTVDRKPENRWLDMGVGMENGLVFQSSSIRLEGELSPRIFTVTFKSIECGVEQAYCIVSDSIGPRDRAHANVNVVGCNR